MGLREYIERLERWAQNDFLADSEAESDRDGYLSYRAEWHPAAWGGAAGLLATITGQMHLLVGAVGWVLTRAGDGKVPEYLPYPSQFKRESAYLLGHAVAGVLLGLVIRIVLVSLGVDVPPIENPAAFLP